MQGDETEDPTAHKRNFPCEQCGSALEYKPGSETLHCPHCGHTQVIAGGAESGATAGASRRQATARSSARRWAARGTGGR